MKKLYQYRPGMNTFLAIVFALAYSFSLRAQSCGEPPAVADDLDGYTAGQYVAQQSPTWGTWSGNGAGTPEDALVTDEQAFSPPNSVKVEGSNGPTDLVLRLGNQTQGSWELRWKLYVQPGFGGYYNIQNNQDINPAQWNLEVYFNGDGTGEVVGSSVVLAQFSYPQGEWIDIVHRINLDDDQAELIVAGQSVHSWVYGPGWNLGGVDFYPANNGPNLFYIDDVLLRPAPPLSPCPGNAIFCDGFEVYLPGAVSAQSANWAPWPGSPPGEGGVQEGPAFVRTGCQSLEVSDEGADGLLLLLGGRTDGNYLLEWWMYIPEGNLGTYNFQKYEDSPGDEFGIQVEWLADGAARLDAGGAGVATFPWAPDTWMHFQHFIDLDNNQASLVVDDAVVYEWPANWQALEQDGVRQLGAVNFSGKEGGLFYLDDVLFAELPRLPGNLCAGAVSLDNQLGQGVGSTASSGPYDNTNYASTAQDPGFGWECFGEPDGSGSAPSLERTMWFTFVGDGNDYRIATLSCGANPIDGGNTQVAVYSGACDALVAVACNEAAPGAPGLSAEVEFTAEAGVVYYMFVDGFGPDSEAIGEYCIEVTQLSQSLVTVTFNVDMSLAETIDPAGVHVAGNFQGWAPGATPLTDNGDGTWSVSVGVEPNQALEYRFFNGAQWGREETSVTEECGIDDGFGSYNRLMEVGQQNITTEFYCFGYCTTCDMVVVDDLNEAALRGGVTAFPNPAGERLTVRISLPEVAEGLSARLLNSFGQVVTDASYGALQTANIEIDVSDVPPGVYLLQVMAGRAQFTQPVIIE